MAGSDLLVVEVDPIKDGAVMVRLKGEVDISSAHLLTSQFSSLAMNTPSTVVLDATEVTFMDSTGLHALVEGKRALHDNGSRIFLVPSRQVRRVLELVFPDPLFAFRLDSVEDALRQLDQEKAEPA
ncbi:MAG TPA: STAS domain-containing protein [Acidimicrobiia bacterium]